MFLYFSKRVFGIFPTLIVISFAVFMIINLIPGDPASIIAGPSASAEQVAALTQERDSLRSRLHAARARVDALIERLPVNQEAP